MTASVVLLVAVASGMNGGQAAVGASDDPEPLDPSPLDELDDDAAAPLPGTKTHMRGV